jgi:hypothetical protein
MKPPIRNLARAAATAAIFASSIFAMTTGANAATEGQKLTAINNGLSFLASQQTGSGSWSYGGYDQAATGAALTAFLSQQSNWGANTAAYQSVVDSGISYLLSTASTTAVSTRNDGVNICPGGASNCTGVYWYGAGEATYTTGLVATAIGQYAALNPNAVATTSGPLANMTWHEIAQGVTNEFAAGQTTASAGLLRGGWRYFPGTNDSDSSTTQWAVISMIYDQSLGAVTPSITKSELNYWLAAAQAGDGSFCYQPGSLCDHADTGGMLLALKFVGDSNSNPQVAAALSFLNNNWPQTASGTWYGNFGDPYAMWAIYKGLETSIGLTDNGTITNLLSNCGAPSNLPGTPPGSVACNWWQDQNQWLVDNQLGDGSWNGTDYWTGVLATSFDVSILGATQIPIPSEEPEPVTISLMAAGLLVLAGMSRRKKV